MRGGSLMVSKLDSGLAILDVWGHCVVYLDETINFFIASDLLDIQVLNVICLQI